MKLFGNFIEAIRGIVPQIKAVDQEGVIITDDKIVDLKKSELVEYIGLLETDKETQKGVLNNLDILKKSISEELYDDAEITTLTNIKDIDDAIVKAKKKLKKLKETFADAIIYNSEGKILFLQRKSEGTFAAGKLGLPGGHIDPGEDAETAVKRELVEETNLEAVKCTLIGELKTKDLEISYFICTYKKYNPLILDNDEHFNYKWLSLDDLKDEESIPGLKDKLEELLDPPNHAIKILKKAFELNQISEKQYLEVLSKAGGAAQLGEVREWGGQKMKKEANGWVPVTEGKGAKKEDDKKGAKGKKDDSKKNKKSDDKGGEQEYTPEQLSAHAKETDSDTLRETAENKNADPSLSEAANAELAERGEEPSIKQKLKEKAKSWNKKQIEMYQSGALDSGSEERKGLKGFLEKKKDGIVKAIKEEGHEIKSAGSGLKKFFTGNKSEITTQEAKAMKTTAIHLGIVVGSMALTGGLGHAIAGKGVAMKLAGLSKGIVTHYLEHQGITKIGHALAFAKAEGEDEISDKDLDKYLKMLVDGLLEHIESGSISEDDWMDIGESSKDDFSMLVDQESEEEVEEESEEKKEGEKKEDKGKEDKKEDKK